MHEIHLETLMCKTHQLRRMHGCGDRLFGENVQGSLQGNISLQSKDALEAFFSALFKVAGLKLTAPSALIIERKERKGDGQMV